MAYCMNCGKELVDGAAFCSSCGKSVSSPVEKNSGRKVVYDGEIHKCPNCGELLKSFETNCSSCGYELRGVKNVSSVKEFAEQLQIIEKQRGEEGIGDILKRRLLRRDKVSAADRQKISLINNFPIPNAKEDIREFMIIATTNKRNLVKQKNEDIAGELYRVWDMKLEQIFQKAVLSFGNDLDYLENLILILERRDRKKLKKMIIKKKRQGLFKSGW